MHGSIFMDYWVHGRLHVGVDEHLHGLPCQKRPLREAHMEFKAWEANLEFVGSFFVEGWVHGSLCVEAKHLHGLALAKSNH